MRVLGIDASLRSTGVGVVEQRLGRCVAVEYGTVKNPPQASHSACLRHVHEEMQRLLADCRPAVVALEAGFYFKNARTAMVLGEVRGVVIALAAAAGLPVYEYPPRWVKQSLTGFGAADKRQVGRMVMSILGLAEAPPEDAADALAVALCHLHAQTGLAELRPEPL